MLEDPRTMANPMTLHDTIYELSWMAKRNLKSKYNYWALDYAVSVLKALAGDTDDRSSSQHVHV